MTMNRMNKRVYYYVGMSGRNNSKAAILPNRGSYIVSVILFMFTLVSCLLCAAMKKAYADGLDGRKLPTVRDYNHPELRRERHNDTHWSNVVREHVNNSRAVIMPKHRLIVICE